MGHGAESTELKIYDASGRLVRNLHIHRFTDVTIHQIFWDGTDDAGRKLPAGVYFISIESSDYQKVEKAVLLR